MGVASIPDGKDQRACDEWNALGSARKMDVAKCATEDFVTVVNVESQPPPENFVTVLSIGQGKKEDEPGQISGTKAQTNGLDGPLEEEVEVFRLPGERLGFGLKFEGGNKTAERVRKLFVQSCEDQSPASRAKCSWGTLGEGDEVLSIDGVPVTHMTRLDCVRRLKESQLVIKLMVRCRGALRPEVVSAEKKSSPEKSKVPPELPSAPPPVPPRKLRQARGLADGEANPSPVRKSWTGARSQTSSQTNSPGSQPISLESKAPSLYESCESSPKSCNGSAQDTPKGSPKERSPELAKSKQEPPEAMVYLDARSQCGSTHGSTSDDTGSSMSTVIDRFSTSDRVSTISTASTASTASEQPSEYPRADAEQPDRPTDRDYQLSKAICLENFEADYTSTPPDYLLRRLASSEAVTHVESRGEVERITAVVAPNTVLIEETITFQPPLSFQDAPLSYGHEARPDLFYTADLAADSSTHFKPIKDDVELVERVNGGHEHFRSPKSSPEKPAGVARSSDRTPPPLPARNHVNRINVNQTVNGDQRDQPAPQKPAGGVAVIEAPQQEVPLLPPKPLPRRDVKVRRKRPPPPPPPPAVAPRSEAKPTAPLAETRQASLEEPVSPKADVPVPKSEDCAAKRADERKPERLEEPKNVPVENGGPLERANSEEKRDTESADSFDVLEDDGYRTNKVLEIIEIRKAKAFCPRRPVEVERKEEEERPSFVANDQTSLDSERIKPAIKACERPKPELRTLVTISTEIEDSGEDSDEATTRFNEPVDKLGDRQSVGDDSSDRGDSPIDENAFRTRTNEHDHNDDDDDDDDDSYSRSLNDVNRNVCGLAGNRSRNENDNVEDDDTSDDSDDDYYWQSNLATIGEEEETNSLEYTTANNEVSDDTTPTEECKSLDSANDRKDTFDLDARNDEVDDAGPAENIDGAEPEHLNAGTVNGRMDNCGGGQRLPPDGDEFPAAYQEFGGGSQQYRFVTASAATRASAMTANGGLVCADSETFIGAESFKLIDGNVVTTASIILPDNRVGLSTVENGRQDAGKLGLSANEINGKTGVDSVCQDASVLDSFPKKPASVTNYAGYGNQGNGNALVSEKKVEITGYYHKDTATVVEEPQDHKEKEPLDTPPPLPLTGPPKVEPAGLYSRSSPALEPPQRKFSLNGELWRQDDKSERSVRDKIAMFSSQSSLDGPLFPSSVTVAAATTNGRRLSKYKSTEDVCSDEKAPSQKERASFFADRTQSSFDLTDSGRSVGPEVCRKYGQRSPSLPQSPSFTPPTIHTSKTFPVVPPKPVVSTAIPLVGSGPKSPLKSYASPTASPQNNVSPTNLGNHQNSSSVPTKAIATTALIRATSFSGSTPYLQDRGATVCSPDLLASSQINRTNSLASTIRRPSEDIRRTSLNQLIEQRRRSISKLRGLVIPEKEAIPIEAPIVDLPEIKSRDSILLHQIPRSNIQDKWGSQSSLASNASTASVPLKATTSFKMPAPQIHSKYSPAFKRKSLTVYGTSGNGSTLNGTTKSCSQSTPTTTATTPPVSEPPKSLESICSPTRSDYSFEFASTASSPEGLRGRPKTAQRKTRMDYDDSDNDSAVSSSQSSISRGFSPPMSPVPSERSTVSSERSYMSTETSYRHRALIMDSPTRTYAKESNAVDYGRASLVNERTFMSERSSSSSSSSDPRSPQPVEPSLARTSQIPQRQLKRSNSTDTNCSTSSTLTSGSQASAESLSRRVLKPQSVEAINRKNILASARCRSGRDLNGSPLIQRKFAEADHLSENGDDRPKIRPKNTVAGPQDVKIAYIEVTDSSFPENNDPFPKEEEPKLPPKRSVPPPIARPPKSELLEPSNDLKMWVRTEAKALARSAELKSAKRIDKKPEPVAETAKQGKAVENEQIARGVNLSPGNRSNEGEANETLKPRGRANESPKKIPEDQNDLLTILTTKSRSRSAIHVDDGSFGRSKSQMSLEDILSAKSEAKFARTQSVETRAERSAGCQNKTLWEPKDNRYGRRSSATTSDSWNDDKPFVSKIPTLGKPRLADNVDETTETEKSKMLSKIPTTRNLGRRSASVTDMKKALEKIEAPSSPLQPAPVASHNRFPSLDSSVDENLSPMGTDVDTDRCCSEQFGSISSLASSTSLISQQELAQLVEEASLEEARGAHDVIVVLLHKENPAGSVGITLAGGADCEVKEITVHRVLAHSIADRDGRVQRGDRILSINGRSTRGLTHRESLAVLKQPRSEVVLVVSRARAEDGCRLRSRTASVETIIEGFEVNGVADDTAWGPPSVVAVYKDGAGLGFSLEGGRDSPLGDRPLVIKKIFTGGAAEKTGALKAGDQLLEVNGNDVTRMSRIEAWSLMKKLHDGEVNLLVRHPATKSS